MKQPVERPTSHYNRLPVAERELADKMILLLIQQARIPSFNALKPEAAKEKILKMMDMGLLRLCKNEARAWWEIHNGKAYIPI